MFWRKKKDPIISLNVDIPQTQMGITTEGNFGIIFRVVETDRRGAQTISTPSFSCPLEEAEVIARCALQAIKQEKKIRANPH